MFLFVVTFLHIETRVMENIRDLAQILAETEDAVLIEDFLVSILTPYEIKEVSSRWELVKMLERGDSQRHIAQELGMSLCKITRGSKELKKENSAFKRVINRRKKCITKCS